MTSDPQQGREGEEHRVATKRLLADLRALARMLDEGMFECGVHRLGAEQEVVLVDRHHQPAPLATEILERLDDARVTTEIARFNLEFNLDPLCLGRTCLRDMRDQLIDLLGKSGAAADEVGARVVLAGILPTLQLTDLGLGNITPKDRYFRLNDKVSRLRGGHYELRIKGIDELTVKHDSVMLEALNTSMQLHFQVSPDEFARVYNASQAIAAPVLAASANSPVLFGKRLWHETRIAIFQQAVDTRADSSPHERDLLARTRFGEGWVEKSILELYKDDVARFRILFGADEDERPLDALDRGEIPKLTALALHNSTVYRWNRPCLGRTDGVPHLRIEARYLPSGPTVEDEIANTAFWLGLMLEMPRACPDLTERLSFDDAKANFVSAARQGLGSQLQWLDGRSVPAKALILEDLLHVARRGLECARVEGADIEHCLGVIHDRVESGRNGAQWMLASIAGMKGRGTRAERLGSLAAATVRRQTEGRPVHEWAPAQLTESGHWRQNYQRVGQYMTTDIFTVQEDELLDLAASIMDWEHVRHVPVEDAHHRLVGLVSYRDLLRYLADPDRASRAEPTSVGDVMERAPVCVTPETPTLEAIAIMKEQAIGCLPVVAAGKLVGMVTEHDFMRIAGQLLEEQFRMGDDAGPPAPSPTPPTPDDGAVERPPA